MALTAPFPIIRRLPGLQDYETCWQAMQAMTAGRNADTADELWLLQHPPVFTLGRNGKEEHLLRAGSIPLLRTDRGGQITYHGPGQIMFYTLVDIARLGIGVRRMVECLEQCVIDTLADYGIHGTARRDAPGVYVDGAKIASLGLRVKRGRVYHGLALNVDVDLAPFSLINPCGYQGLQVTRLRDIAPACDIDSVGDRLLEHLLSGMAYPAAGEPVMQRVAGGA